MKRLNLIISVVGIIAMSVFLFGFVQANLPQEKLEAIKQDIPSEWWEGGWDKLSKLQELKDQYPDNIDIQAQAQYYTACQYYANKDHQRAIQEYQKLINTYPTAWQECQKAQFEIGQIYLYRLDNPQQAILEYQKAFQYYPKSFLTPMTKIGIARAYKRLGQYDLALEAYQAVLNDYPEYKRERTQANLDMAELLTEQALTKGTDEAARKARLAEAISSLKRAYLSCNIEDADLMKQTIDGVYRTFTCLDSNQTRANAFIRFQKYGPEGDDGIPGTRDDVIDPLRDF